MCDTSINPVHSRFGLRTSEMTQGSISTKCALKKKDKEINDYIALLLVHINRQIQFQN